MTLTDEQLAEIEKLARDDIAMFSKSGFDDPNSRRILMLLSELREAREENEIAVKTIANMAVDRAELKTENKRLREALRSMLLSLDASWEESGGHDFGVACAEAREALKEC
jgi:hypothetical protein